MTPTQIKIKTFFCVCECVCVCVCMGVTGYEENATEVKREWLHTYNCWWTTTDFPDYRPNVILIVI